MGVATVLAVLGGIVSFALSYSIGANDAANALGTSVGSGALSLRKAVVMGGVFEFLGTVLMGEFVSTTLQHDIISPLDVSDQNLFAIGMFASLFSATIWLLVATFFKLPVSTTQTIVGGIVGFGLVVKPEAVQYETIVQIILSWFVSPAAGWAGGYLLDLLIEKTVLDHESPARRSRELAPHYSALTVGSLGAFLCTAQVKVFGWPAWIIPIVALVLMVVAFFGMQSYLAREALRNAAGGSEGAGGSTSLLSATSDDESASSREQRLAVERAEAAQRFQALMVATAAAVAFAHGANDVANAIGPFAAIVQLAKKGEIDDSDERIAWWILVMGAVGIVLGLYTLGHRVISTIGSKITKLDYIKGYAAQLSAAIVVVAATFMGLPISTTSTLVGAIAGVGMHASARERRSAVAHVEIELSSDTQEPIPVDSAGPSEAPKSVDKVLLLKIVASWFAVVALGGVGSVVVYFVVKAMYDA